jgi:hypothetical protein
VLTNAGVVPCADTIFRASVRTCRVNESWKKEKEEAEEEEGRESGEACHFA